MMMMVGMVSSVLRATKYCGVSCAISKSGVFVHIMVMKKGVYHFLTSLSLKTNNPERISRWRKTLRVAKAPTDVLKSLQTQLRIGRIASLYAKGANFKTCQG